MMNIENMKGRSLQMKDWKRRLIAFAAALTLLISSCGLTAFAESDIEIYSDPVTAPIAPVETTPAPVEEGAAETPAPEEDTESGAETEEDAGEAMKTEEDVGEATEINKDSGEATEVEEDAGEAAETEEDAGKATETDEDAGEVTETEDGTEPETETSVESAELTVYEPGILAAEMDGVGVTLDYTAEACIPEGALLTLSRIAGSEYFKDMKSAAKILREEHDGVWKREIGDAAVLYHIRLTDAEGNTLHPDAGVKLTCTNLSIPAGSTGFVIGTNTENIDWDGDLTVDFLPEAVGYVNLIQVQIGTVTLVHNDRDYMVTASYGPEAGFPAGTALKVREIMPGTPEYSLYSGMTDEALNEDWSEITLERYFDISFVKDGEELEPQGDVDVQITFRDKIEENDETEVQAVHIENDEATVIESETDSQRSARHDDEAIDTVTFTSDSFSVYGIVQKKKIVTKILDAQGHTYEIEVTYTQEAGIPEDAQVKVEEIPEGSDLWEAYRIQTAAALNADDVRLPGLYDISIVDAEGNKVEPKAAVNVAVKLLNDENTTEDIQVVHFREEIPQELIEAAAQNQENTEQTKVQSAPLAEEDKIASEEIQASVEGDMVTFETKSFSVYAFAYTVDFHYTDTDVSIEGNSQVLLSTLIDKLNITDAEGALIDVNDVVSVSFTDERLVTVEEVSGETEVNGEKVTIEGKDFLLTSNEPFTSAEQLVITLADETEISVDVTDDQESNNLGDFLTKVTVSGASIVDGHYVVEPDKTYNVTMVFKENSNLQFDNEGTLTYTLPQGITLPASSEAPIKIAVVSGGRTYEVPATVTAGETTVTVKFDENDPNFSKLASSTNVSFRVSIDALFNQNIIKTEWSAVIDKDIILDTEDHSDAFAQKSGYFDPASGKFYYMVRVTSNGNTTNVNVKDIISGDALIFNNDVQISGNSSSYTAKTLPSGQKGFDYTFASMADGEEITITYSASLDPEVAKNGGKVTADQTKNSVTVQKEGGDPHTAEFSQEINMKRPDKADGTEAGTTADGNKLYNWTIEYNPLALVSAAGDKITDSIGTSSQEYMKYYGDVTVKVFDHEGTLADTRSFTPGSEFGWSYTVPANDTAPYRYVFEYQTVVDQKAVDGQGKVLQLTNETAGAGGKDSGTINVGPKETITIKKEVESSNSREVTWVSHIHVPEGGLSQAVVTDTLPYIWSGNIGLEGNYTLYDAYKSGTLQISGLLPGESYDPPVITDDKVVITFYKDTDKTQTGLQGTPGGHDITVKLTTLVEERWLQYGYDHPGEKWKATHTNTIDINTDTKDTAEVVFSKPGLSKSGSIIGSWYLYTLVLSGVTEEPVIIEDKFDTALLEVANLTTWNHLKIYGGNQYSQDYGETPVNYSDTPNGILITANSVPRQDNGEFYPYYKITYYLKLKEGVDLDELAVENGGQYDLTNTAIWGDHTSSYTFTTKYDFLDKQILQDASATNRKVKYKITYNLKKGELNGGEDVRMTDRLNEHLSIDYTSIKIETDPAGITIPYSISGDGPETVATYTIPDSTAVTITYDAMVVGNGSVNYKNTVEVRGERKTVDKTANINIDGEGSAAIADLKITKVDGYDANKKLAGVKFKLYASDRRSLSLNENEDLKEVILETDENGVLHIDGNQYQIFLGGTAGQSVKYYIEEVEAPDGYGTISFPYQFTLVDNIENVNYEQFIYFFNDSFQIKNWPLEGIVIEKQVQSPDNNDKEQFYSFRISILNDDGTVNTDYNQKNGDDTFVNGVVEFELKDKEQKMFWGFEKGTKYRVEEIDSKGLTASVTYSIYDEDGAVVETKTESKAAHSGSLTQENEVIIFTNTKEEEETGSLKITKTVKVDNAAPTDANKALTTGTYYFTIWDSAGTTQVTTKADGTTTISELSITVTNGVADPATLTVDGLTPGTYVVKETTPTNGMMLDTTAGGYDSTLGGIAVVVSANDASGVQTAAFTNKTETESVTVTKTWASGSPETPVTFNLYAGNSEANAADSTTIIASIELNGTVDDNAETFTYGEVTASKQETSAWTAAFTGLPKYVGGERQYYVVKESTLTNYTTTYPNSQIYAKSGETIFNTQDTGSVEVSKTFSGIEAAQIPASFQIVATWSTDDGATTNTRTLKITGMENYADVTMSSSDLSYTWTISNLPIGTTVTFTESGYEVAGYNVSSTVTQTTVAEGSPTTTTAPGTSGTATPSADTSLPESAKVAFFNNYVAGVELPATGGSGTLLYTVSGLMLILLAGVLLMSKKRKYNR